MLEFIFYLITFLFLLRRKIDSFSIAAAGVFIYYFPLFTGLLWELDTGGRKITTGATVDVRLQISILILYSFIFIFSFSKFTSEKSFRTEWAISDRKVYLLLILLGFVLCLYILPIALSYTGKTARAAAVGFVHVLFEYMFSLIIAFSFYFLISSDRLRSKILHFLLFLFFVYIAVFVFHTRSVAFFAALSVVVMLIYRQRISSGVFRLNNIKYFAFLALFFVLFIGKHLSNYFFYGVVYDNWFLVALDSLESFLISSSLNYVYFSNIHDFTLSGFFNNFIPVLKPIDYHQFVKERLFYDSSYGMGRNPIGEMWVNFKWLGVFLYSFMIIGKCYLFDYFMMRTKGLLKVFFSLLMLYGVFYINRNSVQTDIVFLRNYIMLMLSAVVISSLIFSSPLLKKFKISLMKEKNHQKIY